MPRYRQYIASDVLTEAKKRLRHVFATFDSVIVSFSGGKDSLAVLHLTHEVAQEMGIKKINAVFRDEELINKVVLDFVEEYRHKEWLDLRWLCVPLASQKFVLGNTSSYTQWDPNRQWVRQKPEWGITNEDLGVDPQHVWSQYDADDIPVSWLKGKVAILTGVRSAESMMRFRSCVNKLNENYIVASPSKRASLVRPIFDWEENDVFRYFYDQQIRYCPLYDNQLWARMGLRVSTPIHAEYAKRFGKVREIDPDLYEAVIEVFPEMQVQERYWGELDREAIVAKYGASFEGVRSWILDNLDDEQQQAKALKELDAVTIREINSPGSYPTEYVLKAMMSGSYKRAIQPLKQKVKK